jgi:hypothetical protein
MQTFLAILSALGLLLGRNKANNTQGRINGSNHANANGIENANVKAGLIAPAYCLLVLVLEVVNNYIYYY